MLHRAALAETLNVWPDAAIESRRFDVPIPAVWKRHAHAKHELLWGVRGDLSVTVDNRIHALPATFGLWVPAGVQHRVQAAAGTSFHCTYIDTSLPLKLPADRVVPVGITVLAAELLGRLASGAALSADDRALVEAVVVRTLEPLPQAPGDLALPSDDRAARVAEGILADPADASTLAEWSLRVNGSVRTLSRLFVQETGMSFAEWRLQARIRAATALLAEGVPVGVVARRVGYRTASAFVAAFRRETGYPPGVFMREMGQTARPLRR